MTITTVNIDAEYSEKLGELAESDKRSKTQELHHLIDAEIARRIKN